MSGRRNSFSSSISVCLISTGKDNIVSDWNRLVRATLGQLSPVTEVSPPVDHISHGGGTGQMVTVAAVSMS